MKGDLVVVLSDNNDGTFSLSRARRCYCNESCAVGEEEAAWLEAHALDYGPESYERRELQRIATRLRSLAQTQTKALP